MQTAASLMGGNRIIGYWSAASSAIYSGVLEHGLEDLTMLITERSEDRVRHDGDCGAARAGKPFANLDN